ncbi:unnamed protein product [Vitrella brassicaformis CCMP3155]|uniref:Uncharacterized protein n=1 Tax=Vitrella brassicaformis (strain CCMP3155) TaxID=1169540 RepID=A0A0G4ECY3_VITBC|nr:unnamed protein product [Vitrella brassicaformis CCMP3155]|eukprot:CEL93417.1 unnamed protein product [Vitrella brassicaformis CCMP3155]
MEGFFVCGCGRVLPDFVWYDDINGMHTFIAHVFAVYCRRRNATTSRGLVSPWSPSNRAAAAGVKNDRTAIILEEGVVNSNDYKELMEVVHNLHLPTAILFLPKRTATAILHTYTTLAGYTPVEALIFHDEHKSKEELNGIGIAGVEIGVAVTDVANMPIEPQQQHLAHVAPSIPKQADFHLLMTTYAPLPGVRGWSCPQDLRPVCPQPMTGPSARLLETTATASHFRAWRSKYASKAIDCWGDVGDDIRRQEVRHHKDIHELKVVEIQAHEDVPATVVRYLGASTSQGGDSPLALQRRDTRELTVSGGAVEPRNLRTEGRPRTLAFSKQKPAVKKEVNTQEPTRQPMTRVPQRVAIRPTNQRAAQHPLLSATTHTRQEYEETKEELSRRNAEANAFREEAMGIIARQQEAIRCAMERIDRLEASGEAKRVQSVGVQAKVLEAPSLTLLQGDNQDEGSSRQRGSRPRHIKTAEMTLSLEMEGFFLCGCGRVLPDFVSQCPECKALEARRDPRRAASSRCCTSSGPTCCGSRWPREGLVAPSMAIEWHNQGKPKDYGLAHGHTLDQVVKEELDAFCGEAKPLKRKKGKHRK